MALLCTQVTQEVLCSHLPQSSAGASSKCDGNLGHSAAPIMLRDRGTQETGREGRSRAGVELFGKVSVGSLGIQVLPKNLFSSARLRLASLYTLQPSTPLHGACVEGATAKARADIPAAVHRGSFVL